MSVDRHSLLQIGEVTERIGLSLRTLRYYEEVGLITPSARTDGGFRLYSEDDIQRLLLVKSMKALDLTLEEMGRLLELLDSSSAVDARDSAELELLIAALSEYADRSARLLQKRRVELVDAEDLRTTMLDRIDRCEAARRPSP